MPDAFARPLSAIDCEMRNLLTLNRDAEQQLISLRRQREQLDLFEYSLVCAMESRRAKLDRLLDERIRSVATQPQTTPQPLAY